jgi:hypothetical protein
MVLRLSALRTRRNLLPRNIIILLFLVIISVRGWVNQRGLVRMGGLSEHNWENWWKACRSRVKLSRYTFRWWSFLYSLGKKRPYVFPLSFCNKGGTTAWMRIKHTRKEFPECSPWCQRIRCVYCWDVFQITLFKICLQLQLKYSYYFNFHNMFRPLRAIFRWNTTSLILPKCTSILQRIRCFCIVCPCGANCFINIYLQFYNLN